MPVAITESTSIDYDVNGEGPPLLLIGGLGFGRWGWFKQVPAFSRHFRTITFDVRGERRLENGVGDLAREAVSLLDHLGVKKAHVLGTSLGGFVAQELALARPDKVDRLVLVCTSYGGLGPESISPRALSDMLGWGSFSAEGAIRTRRVGRRTGPRGCGVGSRRSCGPFGAGGGKRGAPSPGASLPGVVPRAETPACRGGHGTPSLLGASE